MLGGYQQRDYRRPEYRPGHDGEGFGDGGRIGLLQDLDETPGRAVGRIDDYSGGSEGHGGEIAGVGYRQTQLHAQCVGEALEGLKGGGGASRFQPSDG